jgi:hypothetical protein
MDIVATSNNFFYYSVQSMMFSLSLKTYFDSYTISIIFDQSFQHFFFFSLFVGASSFDFTTQTVNLVFYMSPPSPLSIFETFLFAGNFSQLISSLMLLSSSPSQKPDSCLELINIDRVHNWFFYLNY